MLYEVITPFEAPTPLGPAYPGDRSHKQDALSNVRRLRGVRFQPSDSKRNEQRIGLIAQEVERRNNFV